MVLNTLCFQTTWLSSVESSCQHCEEKNEKPRFCADVIKKKMNETPDSGQLEFNKAPNYQKQMSYWLKDLINAREV